AGDLLQGRLDCRPVRSRLRARDETPDDKPHDRRRRGPADCDREVVFHGDPGPARFRVAADHRRPLPRQFRMRRPLLALQRASRVYRPRGRPLATLEHEDPGAVVLSQYFSSRTTPSSTVTSPTSLGCAPSTRTLYAPAGTSTGSPLTVPVATTL